MSKRKPNINNNSDGKTQGREMNGYEDYIKTEILRETFFKEGNADMERTSFLVRELNKINPPKDIDTEQSLQDFYRKYDIPLNMAQHKVRNKRVISLAAAIIVIATSSLVVVGHKFNLFDMYVNRDKNKISYSQDNTDFDKPESLSEASEIITVNTLEEALLYIPFSPIVPDYLPDNRSIETIQINNISDKLIDIRIDYCDISENTDLSIYINYDGLNSDSIVSHSYESDYEIKKNIRILGQDCIITDDKYNHNCSFTFDKAVYNITASKNISLSEFEKILASMN